MKTELDVKKYRQEKTLNLIEKYKSLIDETFEVFEENKTIEEEEGNEEAEDKKLNRIKKRSSALEQVDDFLNKIESLEHHLKESKQTEEGETQGINESKGYQHPTKVRAKN